MKLPYQYTLEAGSISISNKQTLSSAVYDDTDIKNRLSALEGDVSEMKTVDENYGNRLDALAYVANTGNYADLINKPDLSTYVTKDQLSSCGYITINDIPTIPVDYVTEERISQMGYITGAQLSACGYLTSHQSLDGYVNKTDLNNAGYITINDIPSVDLSAYVSKTELSNAGYITSTDIPSVDLSSYVSKTELSNAGYITSIPSEYVTEAELTACGYLTSHQSLDDYVTKSMLSSQSYLTQHQSLADYVTKDDLSNAGYITSVAPVDLSGYVSKTELSNCGYLTEHQDLSAYAPKSYVVEYVASYGGSSTTIDENIIPKENNTYTLGSSSAYYSTAYAAKFNTAFTTGITSNHNYRLLLYVNNTNKCEITGNALSWVDNNSQGTLGTSSSQWAYTYTKNLYCNIDGVSTDIGYYLSYNLSGIETLLANI